MSFKVGNYWLTPKESFDFNSLGKSSADTLHIVTCSKYVYFPFGKLTDRSSLKTSLLKDFTITHFQRGTFVNKDLTPSLQWREFIDLALEDNKLGIFLDNHPEASIHGYIREGHIVNDKVLLLNNIKVGMNAGDFYKTFFDYFPVEMISEYRIVEFESCVADITHFYVFENGKLSSVKFVSQ